MVRVRVRVRLRVRVRVPFRFRVMVRVRVRVRVLFGVTMRALFAVRSRFRSPPELHHVF